jgi:hypothetical protein
VNGNTKEMQDAYRLYSEKLKKINEQFPGDKKLQARDIREFSVHRKKDGKNSSYYRVAIRNAAAELHIEPDERKLDSRQKLSVSLYSHEKSAWIAAFLGADKIIVRNLHAQAMNAITRSLWPQKVGVALDRFERLIIARIVGFAVASMASIEKPPPDCLVIAEASKNFYPPASELSIEVEDVNAGAVTEMLNSPGDTRRIWRAMTGEKGETYLLANVDPSELLQRKFVRVGFTVSVERTIYRIRIVVGSPQFETSYYNLLGRIKDRLDLTKPDGKHPSGGHRDLLVGQPFFQLLLVACVIWPNTREDLAGAFASNEMQLQKTEPAHSSVDLPNLMLWALSSLLANWCRIESNLECICNVLVPEDSGADNLRIRASSKSKPWNLGVTQRGAIEKGQFLSGAVFVANTGMCLSNLSGVKSRLLAFLTEEKVDGALAFPTLEPQSSKPNGSMYVGFYYSNVDDHTKVEKLAGNILTLQLLGLFAGEIIEREKLAESTVKTGTKIGDHKFLDDEQFEKELGHLLKDIIPPKDAPIDQTRPPSTLRLPVLVFSALADSDSETDHQVVDWLEQQVKYLNFETDLAQFLAGIHTVKRSKIIAVMGSPSVLVVVIPYLINKSELRSLREIPTTRNQLRALSGAQSNQEAAINVRIGAWILDYKCSWVQQAWDNEHGEPPEKQITNYLRNWAKVAPYLIRAYKRSREDGDWYESLKQAEAGLEKDPRNPYLLRRASESALITGKLEEAESYATLAYKNDPEHVGSYCIAGDVSLANGEISNAVNMYKKAMELESSHPLPHYSIGFALVTTVKVVRERLLNSFRESSCLSDSDLTNMKEQLTKTDCLLKRADESFKKSRDRLKAWDYEGRAYHKTGFYSPVNDCTLAEAELLRNYLGGSLTEFALAKEAYPDDEHIYRGLLRARLSNSSTNQKLMAELDAVISCSETSS